MISAQLTDALSATIRFLFSILCSKSSQLLRKLTQILQNHPAIPAWQLPWVRVQLYCTDRSLIRTARMATGKIGTTLRKIAAPAGRVFPSLIFIVAGWAGLAVTKAPPVTSKLSTCPENFCCGSSHCEVGGGKCYTTIRPLMSGKARTCSSMNPVKASTFAGSISYGG